jgi:hypothetical protein
MDTDDEISLGRAFVLESTNGQYEATSLSTLEELRFQLLSNPRIIVLPGLLDEPTIQMLKSYGVPHDFVKAHLEGTAYSWRGSRPQDATAPYFWVIPQFVRCCGRCTTEDFAYTTNSRGPVVMLSVSLWSARRLDPSVLLVQRSMTNCQETQVRADPPLEDELRVKLPCAGLNITIQDYINQLAYERWVEYIAEFNLATMYPGLIWEVMEAIEQNLETARYIASEGNTLYFANEHAWESLLRRLDRRMHCIKT